MAEETSSSDRKKTLYRNEAVFPFWRCWIAWAGWGGPKMEKQRAAQAAVRGEGGCGVIRRNAGGRKGFSTMVMAV